MLIELISHEIKVLNLFFAPKEKKLLFQEPTLNFRITVRTVDELNKKTFYTNCSPFCDYFVI